MLPFSNNRRWLGCAIAGLIFVISTASLAATTEPESSPEGVGGSAIPAASPAGAIIERGIQLRRERRDREALALFREAFALDPSARVLTQIAFAEQAIGDWVQAEQDLLEALNDSSAWVEHHRVHLQTSLAAVREHLGSLIVTANVNGAQFTLNGRPFGKVTAEPVRVPVGTVMIVVEVPGYYPGVRASFVEPGASVREEFTLDRRVPAPAARSSYTLEHSETVTRPTSPSLSRSEIKQAAKARDYRTLAWSLVATSGVLLTGAIIAHAASEKLAGEYNDDARCVRGDLTREQRCGTLRQQAHVGRTLAVLGYEAALGTGVVAGVLFERAGALTPNEHPVANGFTVAVRGTW